MKILVTPKAVAKTSANETVELTACSCGFSFKTVLDRNSFGPLLTETLAAERELYETWKKRYTYKT
jgi:hypothetical protein